MTSTRERVEIYTDGGCDPNPGPGGWGAILISGPNRKEISSAAADTTNNRMELTAAVEALRLLRRPCQITLYTDSQYLRRGVTEWLPRWRARGWRRARGGVVQNQDLWQALLEAMAPHEVSWEWLRGHQGHPQNERADQLAGEARRSLVDRRSAKSARGSQSEGATGQHRERPDKASLPSGHRPRARQQVEIYARGCALGVPGPAGYAAKLIFDDDAQVVSGHWPLATSNVMELWSVIAGLRALEGPSQVTIHTGSKYVLDGATRWLPGWERNGWRKRDGNPVMNREIWEELSHVLGDHDVHWHFLPASSDDPHSQEAAQAAREAAEAASHNR
jgi:ribonuclease HI